jgi:hypothetical protein
METFCHKSHIHRVSLQYGACYELWDLTFQKIVSHILQTGIGNSKPVCAGIRNVIPVTHFENIVMYSQAKYMIEVMCSNENVGDSWDANWA